MGIRHVLPFAIFSVLGCEGPAPARTDASSPHVPQRRVTVSFASCGGTANAVGVPIDLHPVVEICEDGYSDCRTSTGGVTGAHFDAGMRNAAGTVEVSDGHAVVTFDAAGEATVDLWVNVPGDPPGSHQERCELTAVVGHIEVTTWSGATGAAHALLPGARFEWLTKIVDGDRHILWVGLENVSVSTSGVIEHRSTSAEGEGRRKDSFEAVAAGVGMFSVRAGKLARDIPIRVASPDDVVAIELRETDFARLNGSDVERPWIPDAPSPKQIGYGYYGIVLTLSDGTIAVGGFDGVHREKGSVYEVGTCGVPEGTPARASGCVGIHRAFAGTSPLSLSFEALTADYVVEMP